MKIKFTQDFKDKVLRAEGGVKFVLKGFVLASSADSVETLDDVRKLNLITNGNDPDKDFIEQLFNVAYTPALEIGKFGTYKLFLPKLTHAVTAILIGECYNESKITVTSTGEYFVAGTIEIEDAATTDVNAALTITFNDDEVQEVFNPIIDSERHDAGTVKCSTNAALWLIPSMTDQQKFGLEEEIKDTIGVEVPTSANAINVLPITERNDAPWNEPVQFSVWDENIPGKPQMLLSYGNPSGADSEFGFERGTNYFAMNAKTDESVNYSLLDNDAAFEAPETSGSCRILGENDELIVGSNDMLLKTKNVTVGGQSSSGSCNNFLMKANDVHVVDSSLLNLYGVTLGNLNHIGNSSDVSVINSQDINVNDSENGLIINSTGIAAEAKNFIALGANESVIDDDNAFVAGGPGLKANFGSDRSFYFGQHNAVNENVEHPYFRWTVSDGYYIPEAHPINPSTGLPIDVSNVTPTENAKSEYARFMKRIDTFSVERGSLPGGSGYTEYFAIRKAFAGGEIKGQGVKPGQLWNVSDTLFLTDKILFTKPTDNSSDGLAEIKIADMRRFINGEFDNVPAVQVDTTVAESEVYATYGARTSKIVLREPIYTLVNASGVVVAITNGNLGDLRKAQEANPGSVIANMNTVIPYELVQWEMAQLFQQGVNSWDYTKPFTFYVVNGSNVDMQYQAYLEKLGPFHALYSKMIPVRAGECVMLRFASTSEVRGIINVSYDA